MIIFVTTVEHAYTHEQVVRATTDMKIRVMNYESLFRQRSPYATYVFTDLDRLSPANLVRAGRCFQHLRNGGSRVLNDPARWLSRAGLLRRLYQLGINSFDAYRVEEGCEPRRWPVFLRTEGDHGHPLSDLLHTSDEVNAAVNQAVKQGVPISALIIVEYAAEQISPGLFRKLSLFRIGTESVAATCVHDDQWLVKYGKKGVATDELYQDELRIVSTNPYWPKLQRVFEVANIDYGRVDFGLVAGKVQIYEINTNPNINFASEHPSELRLDSYRQFRANYLATLRMIDSPVMVVSGRRMK